MQPLSERTDMPPTVGVAGLGSMGAPMARNVLEAGYEVIGYDVRPEPVENLEAAGGRAADAPVDLGRQCDVVLVVVQDEDQTKDVILGKEGIASGVEDRTVTVVICSTIPPEACRDVNDATAESVRVVDAPLCRGDDAAEAGELLVLVGGTAEAVRDVREIFEAFAAPDDIHHFGELGLGQVGKTANNVLLWSGLVADVEVFELCRRYGMDIDDLTDALAKSSGTNWGVNTWTERYPRTIPWAHKDMRIAIEMAERQGVTMPNAGVVRELVRELQAQWEGAS